MKTIIQLIEDKTKICNFIAKTMIILGFPFVVFGIFKIPFWGNLLILPYTMILLVPVLNKYNYFNTSKFIIGIFIPISAALYHSLIIPENSDPISGFLIIQFLLIIIPFLIFTTKEKIPLFIFVLINLILIVFFPIYKNWIIADYNKSFFQTQFFNYLSYASAAIFLIAPYYNILSKNEEFLLEMKNNEIEKNIKLKNQIKENFEKNILFNFSTLLNQINKNRDMTLSTALNFLSENFFISVSYLYVQEYDEEGKEHIMELASFGKTINKKIDWIVGKDFNIVIESFNKNEEMKISELNQNHLRIYSAFGETAPKEVRLIPINSNELKLGILELGFYKILLPEKNEVFYKCIELLSSSLLANFSEVANKKILKDLLINKNIN